MKKNVRKWISVNLVVLLFITSIGMVFVHPTTGLAAKTNHSESKKPKEGAAIFESASNTNTNITGWQLKGKGTLEETEQGLLLTSDPKENVMAISDVVSEDFIYEADIKITDMKADATLLFRSNDDGWGSYMLQIVPNAGIIRLRDAGNEQNVKKEHAVSLTEGAIYHLKVKVIGDTIQVYWQDKYAPIIEVKDATYKKGLLGLNVWDGSAIFQNIKVSEIETNLGSFSYKSGEWEPSIKGLKGLATDALAQQVYSSKLEDFVLEGNISFDDHASVAAITFRTNEQGTTGYLAFLEKEGDNVRVSLKKGDGTLLKESSQTYPTQVDSKHHLEIIAKGNKLTIFMDGYTEAAIEVTDNSYKSGFIGLAVFSGSAYFQDVYQITASNYYTEKYRPAYHYTPARGSVSDPNGLVYFAGEYHLFHQDGGTWAHAVSKDLVNWKRLPIALPWNDHGHVWSGSAVVDETNASGLFTQSGEKGLIAYYTSFNPDGPNGNQRIGLAYSTDQGRTWKYSTEKPIVIENPGQNGEDPGGWDFRDPKVVRDEANNRWVMVVSGGDHIRFFTSSNLIDWELTDNFGYGEYVRGGVWECPDLFQLKIEGTEENKWVLMISTGANPNTQGSDAEYFIGQLTADGKFMNDNPAGKVLRTDYGKEFYASMSFSDMPDNRRVMLAWMTNWDYPFAFPTSGWKGELTIPREVRLVNTEDGVRLAQAPIKELQAIRNTIFETKSKKIHANNATNLLKGLSAGAFEIEAEIEIPSGSKATEFGFQVREGEEEKTVVGYNTVDKNMYIDRSESGEIDFSSKFSTVHEAPLSPENKRIKMNIFVDESSVEVFGNDGKVVFSDVIFPDPSSRGMSFYSKGGEVNIVSLKVHSLTNTWNNGIAADSLIVMDTRDREVSVGDTLSLNAALQTEKGKGNQPIKWKSSNSKVVKIESSSNNKVSLKAKGKGEAIITASTPNGKTSKNVVVRVYEGEFQTNLTGWESFPITAQWTVTENGIRGTHASDANYMAKEKTGDFVLEADMKLSQSGGAASIIFRASEDGKSGYYFNIDPTMKAFRLFYKVDGNVEERMVISKIPAFLSLGKTYKVKIDAQGPRIQVHVDSQKIMDLQDGTFAEGYFSLHVFGGQASFQHVKASQLKEAKLTTTTLINPSSGKSLYVASSENGESVIVMEAGEATKWVFIPTGDEFESYSIRTEGGKALDLDTGQNKIQLYHYLGFNNQRWIITKNENETISITSVHHDKVLEIGENGMLTLNDVQQGSERQEWILSSELK